MFELSALAKTIVQCFQLHHSSSSAAQYVQNHHETLAACLFIVPELAMPERYAAVDREIYRCNSSGAARLPAKTPAQSVDHILTLLLSGQKSGGSVVCVVCAFAASFFVSNVSSSSQ